MSKANVRVTAVMPSECADMLDALASKTFSDRSGVIRRLIAEAHAGEIGSSKAANSKTPPLPQPGDSIDFATARQSGMAFAVPSSPEFEYCFIVRKKGCDVHQRPAGTRGAWVQTITDADMRGESHKSDAAYRDMKERLDRTQAAVTDLKAGLGVAVED